jgi:NitT/TauT family transport system substrate-binding protein
LDTIKIGHGVLTELKRVKPLDIGAWVNETYVKEAFKEAKLDYDSQKQSMASFDISGTDKFCKTAITRPKEAGEVWVQGAAAVEPHASALCTLGAIGKLEASGKKIQASYLTDQALGIKVFADKAFYAVNAKDPKKPVIVPFLLKKDAQAHATKIGGKVVDFREALTVASAPF